jgi:chaperonin GroES
MTKLNTMVIPLGDRLIVRLVTVGRQAETSPAGAEPLADDAVRGVVIAAGSGRPDSYGQSVPLTIAAGDIIVFGKHRGQEITFGGMQCWIINADDIVRVEVRSTLPVLRGESRQPRR